MLKDVEELVLSGFRMHGFEMNISRVAKNERPPLMQIVHREKLKCQCEEFGLKENVSSKKIKTYDLTLFGCF